MYNRKNKAFTLVELAIVLVVISLLVVGILQGQALIKVGQLRKIVTSVEELSRVYNTFQAKYNCLPGDCIRATSFLGSGTINGNGDEEITPFTEGTDLIFENLLFFEHTGLAGLYEHNSGGDADCYFNPTIDDIAVFFSDCNYPIPSMNSTIFIYGYSEFLGLTKARKPFACIGTTVGCITASDSSSLSVEDIRQLDVTIDDGKPLKGSVLSACTSDINDFLDYSTADIEKDYDTSLSRCPIIVKF